MRPMEISTTLTTEPVADDRLAGDPGEPGLRRALHRPHVHGASGRPAEGWHDARITPYGPLTLDPATAVLHYAQEIFEGMKAYRHDDGSIWTFRPEENAERMVRSSRRLALPELPAGRLRAGRRRAGPGRPALGARRRRARRASTCGRSCSPPRRSSASGPAEHVTFMVIASPAGAYFKRGPRCRSRSGSPRTTPAPAAAAWARPRPAATTRPRSSPSRRPRRTAATRSSSSTPRSGRYVEELGGMNMYFVYADGRIVTPRARHDPRGHHPRQHHRARRQDGPPGRGAQDLHRRVARRRRRRRDHRGVRLRHRRRRHARSAR